MRGGGGEGEIDLAQYGLVSAHPDGEEGGRPDLRERERMRGNERGKREGREREREQREQREERERETTLDPGNKPHAKKNARALSPFLYLTRAPAPAPAHARDTHG